MTELTPEQEEAMNIIDCHVKVISTGKIDGKQVDPWIVVGEMNNKLTITVNKNKLYRCLHTKNHIQNALDTHLVNKIKELLRTLAEREEHKEGLK